MYGGAENGLFLILPTGKPQRFQTKQMIPTRFGRLMARGLLMPTRLLEKCILEFSSRGWTVWGKNCLCSWRGIFVRAFTLETFLATYQMSVMGLGVGAITGAMILSFRATSKMVEPESDTM